VSHPLADTIHAAVSYMPELGFNRALLPLLQSGEVDALEWSFDTVDDVAALPSWMYALLKEYSDAGRLYGHGVYYSLLSGGGSGRIAAWLQRLKNVQEHFQFQHLSEHFGFMTSGNAHQGAPLPVPLSPETLALGTARLEALSVTAGIPVGIENLALAFSKEDVLRHGEFLERLVEPVDGFILLDLHNIYCSAHNFGLDARELLATYPLHRVKEMHLSGGSWEPSEHSAHPVRRDTHDDAVPEEVFALLEWALPRCPRTDVVVLERLGDTLREEQDEQGFRQDFRRMRQIIQAASPAQRGAWPSRAQHPAALLGREDEALARQQAIILQTLKSSQDARTAQQILSHHPALTGTAWAAEQWSLPMVETAMLLGEKWGIEEAEN
jgi:uncharacterized protein (UPF0276 family)